MLAEQSEVSLFVKVNMSTAGTRRRSPVPELETGAPRVGRVGLQLQHGEQYND